jgi:multisubunit Na+/H+ antiporter MnhG subunit
MPNHRAAAAVVTRGLGVTLATLAVAVLALDVHRFGLAAGILALALVALAAVAVTTPPIESDRATHSGPVERHATRRAPPTGVRAS